jgi:hypothetical protein
MKFLIFILFSIFFQSIYCGGPSPSSKPWPEACVKDKSRDLTGPDGRYIKTACYINYTLTYDDAVKECAENGDILFKLTDQSAYDAFIALVTEVFGETTLQIFANGRKDGDGNWITEPESEPIYSGATWVGDQSQDCLVGAYLDGTWGLSSRSCDEPTSGYCQFDIYAEESSHQARLQHL